jgi:hypothetical protein
MLFQDVRKRFGTMLRGGRVSPRYLAARNSLLAPDRATRVLELNEVTRAASELSGDPRDLRLYDMETADWHQLGIRITGRTAVEATRDPQAAHIGASVAATLAERGHRVGLVVDPFVGSGNLLFHVARATGATRAVGFDVDGAMLALTQENFQRIPGDSFGRAADYCFVHGDWMAAIDLLLREDDGSATTLVVVDPPWGEAYSLKGLDLSKTTPPVPEILARTHCHPAAGALFVVVKVVPNLTPGAIEALRAEYVFLETRPAADADVAARVDYLLLRLA